MAEAPIFLETDMEAIRAEIVALYEDLTGKPLNPAQVENLVLNVLAYRETKLRGELQDAITLNLLEFSRGIILDYLGELTGAYRLAAEAATVPMLVTLVTGHTGVTVPEGTRIASTDGMAVFSLVESVFVPAGTLTVTINSICQTEGEAGNGYAPGVVNKVLDPQAYIVSITNTIETAGGSELEGDDGFKRRIRLSPAQFSTAGSDDAYRYHALSANAGIIDVDVYSPVDTGEVYLRPLMADGEITPPQVLDAVEAKCSAKTVRPVSDLVIVEAPDRIDYTLAVEIVIFSDFINAGLDVAVADALAAYVLEKRQKLGQDIIEAQIIAAAQLNGVYDTTPVGFADIIVSNAEYAYCTGITVTVTGVTNG